MRTRTRRLRTVLLVAGVLFVSSSASACTSGPCVVVPGVAQYCAGPAT